MRVCNKCGKSKNDSEFYTYLSKNKTKRLLKCECKNCKYDRQKQSRQKEYDSRVKTIETHRICKKCKVLQPIEEYRLKLSTGKKGHKVRYRSKSCKSCERHAWKRSQVDNIAPYYAKRLIEKGLKTEATDSMVEVKRVEIIINRIKNVINKKNDGT